MCALSEGPPETVSGATHGWRRGRNHHQLGGRLQLAMAGLRGDVTKSLLSVGKVCWWQLAMAGLCGVVMKNVALCCQR